LNKKKIINDPVYGFITIPFEIIHDIIGHPWFQRLTRIRQLGLTYLVYPGALHTRFHHTLGAMHLMASAVETLKSKGHAITEEEAEGALIAILMHDIGHGPFSHALEKLLVKDVSHETISAAIMQHLNREMDGRFTTAISIFNNTHPKKFLHQLVSSQLDVDRLDYLNRDSFFTGVSEGVISSDRIIKMLDIANGNLAVEEKGIYSVEKFITARRLMYWQVYLHKTVLAAEYMLINIMLRARELSLAGNDIPGPPSLLSFLHYDSGEHGFLSDPSVLEQFNEIDDVDVFAAIKSWCRHPDKVLATLCRCLVNRNLFKIEISRTPYEQSIITERQKQIAIHLAIPLEEAATLCFHMR
jgi:HD superfamily phosphohydrolase